MLADNHCDCLGLTLVHVQDLLSAATIGNNCKHCLQDMQLSNEVWQCARDIHIPSHCCWPGRQPRLVQRYHCSNASPHFERCSKTFPCNSFWTMLWLLTIAIRFAVMTLRNWLGYHTWLFWLGHVVTVFVSDFLLMCFETSYPWRHYSLLRYRNVCGDVYSVYMRMFAGCWSAHTVIRRYSMYTQILPCYSSICLIWISGN